MRTYGPKTIQITAPNIGTGVNKNVVRNVVTANDAPRAGQQWNIDSVYFNFSEAQKTNENVLAGLPLEQKFIISMSLGGVTVATQEIIERGKTDTPEVVESAIPALGALEPITPAILYPGMNLGIEYRVSKNLGPGGNLSSGVGLIVITYHLITR